MDDRDYSCPDDQSTRIGRKLLHITKEQSCSGACRENRNAHYRSLKHDNPAALPELDRASGGPKPRKDNRRIGSEEQHRNKNQRIEERDSAPASWDADVNTRDHQNSHRG